VELYDGQVGTYTANVIAGNIYEQVEEDGNEYTMLDSIVDHQKGDNAVENAHAKIVINGKVHPKRTTKGWKLCV
jgi:uncharacterized FAD-dependent dehydrogenase